MFSKIRSTLILFAVVLLASSAEAKVQYDSTTLLLKNSDQVNAMLNEKIKAAHKLQAKQEDNEDGEIAPEPEALEQLKDALRIALARPERDGARANLYGRVRRELVDVGALDQVLAELTEESLAELRVQSGPRKSATYVVILENMMWELKPQLAENSSYRKILERIRDAKISITGDTKMKNQLRSMSIVKSPSETATKFLNAVPAAPPEAAPSEKKKK